MEKLKTSSFAPPIDLPEALQAPVRPASLSLVLALLVGNIAANFCYLNIIILVLPLQLSILDPANKVTALTTITAIGALFGIMGVPVIGALSDRTTSRFGRRRPWFLFGTLLCVVGLLALMHAQTVFVLLIAWCAFQIFFSAINAPLYAIIPDNVPANQRGVVSSTFGLGLSVGVVLGTIIFGQIIKNYSGSYLVMIIVIVVVFLPFAFFLRDKVLPKDYLPPFHLSTFMKSFWISPRTYPDFAWAWLTRFFPFLGYTIGSTLLFYYIQDAVKYQQVFPGQTALQGTSMFYLVSTIFLVVSTIVGGILSDRLQRRKVFVISSLILLGISLLLLGFFPVWQMVLIASAVLGLGFGTYLSVDMALVTFLLPKAENRGKDLGVIFMAQALAQLVAPVMAGIIVNGTHSYTVLFLVSAIIVFSGILAVLQIKTVR